MILESKADVNAKVQKGVELPGNLKMDGFTAIAFAGVSCTSQYPEESSAILKLLIDAKSNPYQLATNGMSAMCAACVSYNHFFWKYMFKNYDDFSFSRPVVIDGTTLLHLECMLNGDLDMWRCAVSSGADIHDLMFNVRNIWGEQAIILSTTSAMDYSRSQRPGVLFKWCLENKIITDVNDIQADVRKVAVTPISCAFRILEASFRWTYRLRGRSAMRKMGVLPAILIKSHRASLLHFCCFWGSNIDLLHLVIEARADLHAKNSIGFTPLDYAVKYKHHAHIEVMRKAIADEKDREAKNAISVQKA